MMTPERWQQVEEVLQAALDCAPPERASFLDKACAGDDGLKSEATTLIHAHDDASGFLESPAIAQDARVIVGDLIDINIGRSIGSYEIIERLGAGGMGEVYLAQDERLNRPVALKILPAYFATNEMRLRRFQREARAVSALNHPNILTIHEVGEADDIHFIATEFINGQTIRELIATHQLSLDEILDIAAQVAFGLAAAHDAGIVHRDIKPENIMRRADGLVKILDFGIAKLTESSAHALSNDADGAMLHRTQTEAGAVMGTVGYMSPEQARGFSVDERTDIWSLGCVLYEMLAHQSPFASATRMDTLVAVLEREPPPVFQSTPFAKDTSALLQNLERIVSKTLRKQTSERYRTMTELLADLESVRRLDATSKAFVFSSAASIVAPASLDTVLSSQKGLRRLSPRRRAFVALIAAAALMLAMIAGTFLYQRSIVRRAASNADGAPIVFVPSNKLYAQMTDAEQNRFIDEQAQRISAMMGDRRVKLNEDAVQVIKKYVDYYAAPRQPGMNHYEGEALPAAYARAAPYLPLIAREFAARKVPVIVGIYLPMIESGYRACFESKLGAKGLFQFLPQTAKLYGVAPEEMCDAKKMTPAAAHYIADRMAELGDDSESMTLVLLSYNRGAESVRSELRQLRTQDDYERNFWTLYANRGQLDDEFRNEGANYVPSFFAAAIIGENPQNFGLQTPPLSTLTTERAPVIP